VTKSKRITAIPEIPEWDVRARISAEKNLTGFFFSGHPLDDIKVLWKQTVSINLARAASANSAKKLYQVMGVINDIRVIVTKQGH
jgi:DNA polymerase-3 subunit alpha